MEPKVSRAVITLYDEYTHAPLERRVFLDRLAQIAGGTAAAAALLPLLESNYARAQVVAVDDGRLATDTVTIPVPGGTLWAYVAKPANAAGRLPAVVVVHENRGLNPHIRDVARRVALGGFVAVAPDFLSPGKGGTPDDEDRARTLIGDLDANATLADAEAVVAYAGTGRDDVTGKVGTVGFCWGGGLVNRMAAGNPQPAATVSFYGRQATAEETARIKAPLLLHYAGLDERINAGIAAFVAALDAAGARYRLHLYEGVNHAFNNDTAGSRYDKAAADLAWTRTMAFLDQHLKAPG